jgi:hypothetical protein
VNRERRKYVQSWRNPLVLALTDDTLVCRFHVGTCEDERFSTSVRHVGLIVSVRRENARVCREEHFNAFGTVKSSYVQISVGRGKSVMKQTLALVLGIMCFLALTSLVFHQGTVRGTPADRL